MAKEDLFVTATKHIFKKLWNPATTLFYKMECLPELQVYLKKKEEDKCIKS